MSKTATTDGQDHNSGPQTHCESDFDPLSAELEVALQQILSAVEPLADCQQLPLNQCLNRVLAEDIIATINVPDHASSAMDGYAFCHADLQSSSTSAIQRLPVSGCNFAGLPTVSQLTPGTAVRIMTGAVMPAGADTVVMQERVNVHAASDTDNGVAKAEQNLLTADATELIELPEAIKQGQNVRARGDDVIIGQALLAAGQLLNPAAIAALAAQGLKNIKVKRQLKVAVFVTGDELQTPGQDLQLGQIYDSNRLMLIMAISALGHAAVDLGRVADTAEALQQMLSSTAVQQVDALITTGGVSVGAADFVRDAVAKVGQLQLWRVAIKPGRPFASGQIGNTAFFGLPGNPVSSMVTLMLLVVPALQKMAGMPPSQPLRLAARSTQPLKKRPGRMEFQRGHYQNGEVTAVADQGSGRLSSLLNANCLIELSSDQAAVAAGEMVTILPLAADGLLLQQASCN